MLPGVSFKIDRGRLSPALGRAAAVAVICTYGATRWQAVLMGDPPRRFATRSLRATFRPARLRYVARYGMNTIDRAGGEAFLARVRREMARL
jgi:hypothetical protein